MKAIPLNEETATIAAQIIWFDPPAKSLSDPVRFMAYAMTYAMHEEMRVIRRYVSDEDFKEALDHTPPASSIRAHGRTGIPKWDAILRRHCPYGGSNISWVQRKSSSRHLRAGHDVSAETSAHQSEHALRWGGQHHELCD
jgi:hypothetical protein